MSIEFGDGYNELSLVKSFAVVPHGTVSHSTNLSSRYAQVLKIGETTTVNVYSRHVLSALDRTHANIANSNICVVHKNVANLQDVSQVSKGTLFLCGRWGTALSSTTLFFCVLSLNWPQKLIGSKFMRLSDN
jgi:hypothetical protein